MKKKTKIKIAVTGVLLLLFALLTAAVMTIDVQPIGPLESRVGLATINGFMFDLLGQNMLWYNITEIIGYIPIVVALGFAAVGLFQLVKRRSLKRVDASLIALGVFYLLVGALYAFFEVCIINYRPILIEASLEPSFPSSHILLALCIMATAIIRFRALLSNKVIRTAANIGAVSVIAVIIVGRLISGVHWFTDVIGALLLGSALIMLYSLATQYIGFREGGGDQ